MDESTIFAKAVEFDDKDERNSFLDSACGDDAKLKKRINALIQANGNSDSLLDKPICLHETATVQPSNQFAAVGQRIGPYKLLEEIGEGGMGIVYVAEREKPLRQRVALKVIKPGMDTREVIARFEAERQALALMDHPNVAKVLDAGTTEFGRPYFVMEHIKGTPITEYCDERNLSTKARLRLFRQVCQGVQHSHQKGIIHRDLKPSNILVAEYDHEPVPKIIDFGVAKALNQSLTDKTLYTRRLNIVGTLQYMSPEQAKMNQRDIDTRSDIYSLGVVLYELLTSRPPFERKTLEDAGLEGMCKIIREKEPPKPSDRLLTMEADTATDVAKHRSSQQQSLSKIFKGDLDWIVMKALDKDRNRRYETANGLSKDIERYLCNENVNASPPTLGYRIWKAYSRNKPVVWTSGAFAVMLSIGTIVSVWGWISAVDNARQSEANAILAEGARKEAVEQEQLAATKASEAERERIEAERQKAVSEAVNDILNNQILMAVAPSDQPGRGKDATLEEVLKQLLVTLDEQPDGLVEKMATVPLVEARLRMTLGKAFTEMGEFELAENTLSRAHELYKRELGNEHSQTSLANFHLGSNQLWQRKNKDALKLFQQATIGLGNSLGEHDISTFRSRLWAAWAIRRTGKLGTAIEAFNELLADSRDGELLNDELRALTSVLLASIYADLSNSDRARQLLARAQRFESSKHSWPTFSLMYYQCLKGYTEYVIGDHTRAVQTYQAALPSLRDILGNQHPITLSSIFNLSSALFNLGRSDQAKKLLIELEQLYELNGAEKDIKAARYNLAGIYENSGDSHTASRIFMKSYHEFQAAGHFGHAINSLRVGGLENEARELVATETQKRIENHKRLGATDPTYMKKSLFFAYQLRERSEFSACEKLSQYVVDEISPEALPNPSHRMYWFLNLGESQLMNGNVDASISNLRFANELADELYDTSGTEHLYSEHDHRWPKVLLGRAFLSKGDLTQAEEMLTTAYFGFSPFARKSRRRLFRELDRLLLLDNRSTGEIQKRFEKQCLEFARDEKENHWALIVVANDLFALGAVETSKRVLEELQAEETKMSSLQLSALRHFDVAWP